MEAREIRAQFIRDHVTPTLKAAGYRKSGQTYRCIREGGHQAVISVRAPREPTHPVDLIVEEGLLVEDWHRFIRWSQGEPGPRVTPPFERASVASGPVRGRLRPATGAGRFFSGGTWKFRPEDAEVVALFAQLLTTDAAVYAELTDPVALEKRLRTSGLNLDVTSPPAEVMLTVILAGQGRIDEAKSFLAKATNWFIYDDLAAWIDAQRHERG